jgi:AraC-like DNA-binding protein
VVRQERNDAMSRHHFTDLNALPLALRLGNFTGEMLFWGLMEPRLWRNYLHTHSFFEVCYAFRGQGTFRMLGTDFAVCAGEVFVAKPGEPHEIISYSKDPLGIYYWAYTLVPRCDHDADGSEIDALLDAFALSSTWVSSRAWGMEATLELLTEEIRRKQPGYRRAIEALVTKLLLDTARSVLELPDKPFMDDTPARGPSEATVRSIVRYIRDNYARPLSIGDIAAQINLSERHASRLFSAAMGLSVMDYVTALRMEIAAQLLLDHHLSVNEIARATGYPDVRYFATVFRQRKGLTPTAFRQQGGTMFLHAPAPAM